MKREKIVFIIGLISILIGSIVSVSAVTYLYNANEVSYDNSTSHLNSTDVQGAINELYDAAQDYSSMNTRVSLLEDRWVAGGRVLAIKESTSSLRGIQFLNASNGVSSYLYYSPSDDETVIRADTSSGSAGNGTLNLRGNPVKVNGVSISDIGTWGSYAPDAKSVATGTWTNLISFTLSPGIWIITFGGNFVSNSTGYRQIRLGTASGTSSYINFNTMLTGNAVNGEATRLHSTIVLKVDSSTTYYLNAYQNSGSSLNTYGRVSYVKIISY